MAKVTLSKGEFDKFWDEVLGRNWCIEDWDVDGDLYENAQDDTILTISTLSLAWELRNEPEPNEYMTPARLRSLDHLPVLRAWLKHQAMRQVSAWIPADSVPEFEAFLKRVGGQR